jgi:hypothetical protein
VNAQKEIMLPVEGLSSLQTQALAKFCEQRNLKQTIPLRLWIEFVSSPEWNATLE